MPKEKQNAHKTELTLLDLDTFIFIFSYDAYAIITKAMKSNSEDNASPITSG